MAEGLLRARLAERGREVPVVASAGTEIRDQEDRGATSAAVEALADRGIDLASHVTTPLSVETVDKADLLVAMTRRNESAVDLLQSVARSRTFLAGEGGRLGGQVGPRGDRSMADWVRALDGARGGHFTAGRLADEVGDPWGGPDEEYRRCADQLDGICTALARLMT